MKQKPHQRMRKKGLILGKLLASMYLLIFAAGFFTSGTSAYFNDKDKETFTMQAGTWWDGSELAFAGKPSRSSDEPCPPEAITIKLQNHGQAMMGPTNYKVYRAKDDNPKNGKVVKEGKVGPLQAGETKTVSYENVKKGTYRFKVTQRPEYEDENNDPEAVWSETISVTSAQNDKEKKEDQNPQETKNKQQKKNNHSDGKKQTSHGDKETDESKSKKKSGETTKDKANQKSKMDDTSGKDSNKSDQGEQDTKKNKSKKSADQSTAKQSVATQKASQQEDRAKQATTSAKDAGKETAKDERSK